MLKADSFFAEVCCKGKRDKGRSWGERGTVKDCFNIGETLTSLYANVTTQRGRKRRWCGKRSVLAPVWRGRPPSQGEGGACPGLRAAVGKPAGYQTQ